MTEYLFQIFLFILGVFLQIIKPPKKYNVVVGIVLIVFSSSWISFEIGKKQVPKECPEYPPRTETFTWPSHVNYFDFESSGDEKDWAETPISIITRSDKQAFTGKYSLEVSSKETGNEPEDYILANWGHPFQAEVITGQIYWPRKDGVSVTWAQICTQGGDCSTRIPIKYDRWNAFTIDLYNSTDDDEIRYSDKEFTGLYLQGGIKMEDKSNRYTFYIDAIQVFNTLTPNLSQ